MSTLLSTPAKNTLNSATKFAATTPERSELSKNMDSEMRKHFVGPMPIRKFFDSFLPVQLSTKRRKRLQSFEAMAELRLESEMYNEFVRPFSS